MTLPFAGHPVGARNAKEAQNEEDKIESAYRFLLADLMPFGKNALIRLEHGGTNESTEHYETVTYWYGLPAPSLVKTDELRVGDEASETQHRYASPEASQPYEITSRYEWGVDTLKGRGDLPAAHGPRAEDEDKFGVHAADRPAEPRRDAAAQAGLCVPEPAGGGVRQRSGKEPDWKPAGIWYLAGSNTCVYSYPPNRDELGATRHVVADLEPALP